MRLRLKENANDVFKMHRSSNKPPIKELVTALIDVSANIAVSFGCSKDSFMKIALNAYERSVKPNNIMHNTFGMNKNKMLN